MNATPFFRKTWTIALVYCFFIALSSQAVNPQLLNDWTNLSSEVNAEDAEDRRAEMKIVDNTIHVVWFEYKSSNYTKVWYKKSGDLGKTWQPAILLMQLVATSAVGGNECTQKLSVVDNVVHISFADYEYNNKGIAKLYYFRSTNNGDSFEEGKVLSVSEGTYTTMRSSIIRAVGTKIAIVYERERWINGNNRYFDIRAAFSTDNGSTFRDTVVVQATEKHSLCDFIYDGNQAFILSQYLYYYYGLNIGRVYATVSNNNGNSFTSTKLSRPYIVDETSYERSIVYSHGTYNNYKPNLGKSGNTLYAVFDDFWGNVVFSRSVDNGLSFEEPLYITPPSSKYEGSTLLAQGNEVYLAYKWGSKCMGSQSKNKGASFSETVELIPPVQNSYAPNASNFQFILNPYEEAGNNVYLSGNSHCLIKWGSDWKKPEKVITYAAANNKSTIHLNTSNAFDKNQQVHWLIHHQPEVAGTNVDVYHSVTGSSPEPGQTNKSLLVKHLLNSSEGLGLAVPYHTSLAFDSLLTVELWVKLNPEACKNSQAILYKLRNGGFSDGSPEGFQISYRRDNNQFFFTSAIKTDKQVFVNYAPTLTNDSLWHHVAFTYNAKGGLGNFITYVDGQLATKQTATGAIDLGQGMINIGNVFSLNAQTEYQIDDIRIWNRALSQKELEANLSRKDFSNEPNLKLYIGFDDTFKDLSGNGNDAILYKYGSFKNANFNPPVAKFDVYKALNEVSLTNKTENGLSYTWNFGNGKGSVLDNPKYQYPSPGEYTITLQAINNNAVTSASAAVSIEGLDRVYPVKAGNGGIVSLDVYGGALQAQNTRILLRKTGEADIVSDTPRLIATGNLQANFQLWDAAVGNWDVVVKQGATEMVLPEAFKIEPLRSGENWVQLSGRNLALLNKFTTYQINYGNKSNIDSYSVPLWLTITESPQLEFEFIDFTMNLPEAFKDHPEKDLALSIGTSFVADSINGQAKRVRVIPLLIPVIRANSSNTLSLRIKSTDEIEINAYLDRPWIATEELQEMFPSAAMAYTRSGAPGFSAGCVLKTLGMGVVDATTSVLPGVGCVWGGIRIVNTVYEQATSSKPSVWNAVWNIGLATASCGVSLAQDLAFPIKWGMAVLNFGNAVYDLRNCRRPGDEDDKKVRYVSSIDPNEMIGPNGFGENNWIKPPSEVPYTILFENLGSATAPAHDVFIQDTLDLTVFDINSFSFGKYGWGDSIRYQTQEGLKSFSHDIDLRPQKDLILRVSGKLDTLSGIVSFEFLSLNPITMAEEEDPFLGFLPPNGDNHEGEGFVSFTVGLKPNLPTGTELRNLASIVFDANAAIITNEYVNTLDDTYPESSVTEVEDLGQRTLLVKWSGADLGSGIKSYSVWAKKDEGEYMPVILNSNETSGTFQPEAPGVYQFYCVATDNAYHEEVAPESHQFQYVYTSLNNLPQNNRLLTLYPNPTSDRIQVQLQEAQVNAIYQVDIIGLDGKKVFSQKYLGEELHKGIQLSTSGFASGIYLLRVTKGHTSYVQELLIK